MFVSFNCHFYQESLPNVSPCVGKYSVQKVRGKGLGVFAAVDVKRGTVIDYYHGKLTTAAEAKTNQKTGESGNYVFYFTTITTCANGSYCMQDLAIDATHSNGIGRLVNHTKRKNKINVQWQWVAAVITQRDREEPTPSLLGICSQDISAGEELLYHYQDRSAEAKKWHPWL